MAALPGASHWVEIENWVERHEEWLSKILALPHGLSLHDTFRRVVALLHPQVLVEAFADWTRQLAGQVKGVVALEGKTVQRSLSVADGRGPIRVVSASALGSRLVLSQVKVEDKSNGILRHPEPLNIWEALRKSHLWRLDLSPRAIGRSPIPGPSRSRETSSL